MTNLPVTVPRLTQAVLWPTSNISLAYMSGFQQISYRQQQNYDPTPKKFRAQDQWTFTPSTLSWTPGTTKPPQTSLMNGTTTKNPIYFASGSTATVWIPELQKGYIMGGVQMPDPSRANIPHPPDRSNKALLEFTARTIHGGG